MSKDGRKFFYFSTAFFADRKIKILKARYGSDGLVLFIYLMCEIYREDGYYLRYDDDFEYIISADLGMNYQKIGQILNFLLERSLFDNTLFRSDKVLTSREIQMTFQEAVKGKAVKNPVAVCDRLWLLKKDETAAFIQVQHENEISGNSVSDSRKKAADSGNLTTKQSKANIKQSKVKQSKAKGIIGAADAADDAAAGKQYEKIEKAFNDATGRHLSVTDYKAIADLTDVGVTETLIVNVINEVAKRGGSIHSFAYFIPAIRDAATKNVRAGFYPSTAPTEYIETVLDEEYLSWLDSIPDKEYTYDD